MVRMLRVGEGMYETVQMSWTRVMGVKEMRPRVAKRLLTVNGHALQDDKF